MTVATEIYATGLHPCFGKAGFRGAHAGGKGGQRSFFFLVQTRAAGCASRPRLLASAWMAAADRLLGGRQTEAARNRRS